MLDSLVREGLLIPRMAGGEPRFTTADVTMLTGGMRLLEAGLPLPELFALARHHHAVTREVAVEAVELFDTWVRKPLRASDLPEDEKAERLVQAFNTLMPAVTALVAHHFRRILLQVAQEHLEAVGDRSELDAAAADEAWRDARRPGLPAPPERSAGLAGSPSRAGGRSDQRVQSA